MMLLKKGPKSFLGILVLVTLCGIGCADKKKGSSSPPPPPAPAPAPLPQCAPGAPTTGCTPTGTIGVPPQTVPPGGYQYGSGTCPAGQIYTIYNCLPVTGCPANQGMYNNQCIPGMSIGGNGVPYGFSNQNGSWGYYYNSYPYYNNGYYGGGYGNGYGNGYGYPYGGYYYGYPYNTNLGFGFSAWVR